MSWSEESRAAARERMQRRLPAFIAAMNSPEAREKRFRALKSAGAKISALAKASWADPAVRERRVAGIRRAKGSAWLAALTPAEKKFYRKLLKCGLGRDRARNEINGMREKGMEPAMMTIWTTERIDELDRLVALGLSFTEIAARMHLTKGQVIGKAQRLHIERGEREPFASTYQPKRQIHD